MSGKRWLLVCLSLLTLTGMRDPFKPPEDRCKTSELLQWRFQGAVSQGEKLIGIVKDSQQKWHRVEHDESLDNGWRVSQLTTQTLTLALGEDCEPSQWQWQRQGERDEAMDSRRDDGHDAGSAGGKSAKRNANGG
ncbi:DUF2531 family protein [Citrobacter sp. Awk 4]|uniref:HofP DNA utilization family protein n=1 Tax=Citrobacter sp. Awk 4 TaxID=2963955 RepID=UPI0023027001|nr:HofP DNA utilization family protein [Citrobacter sp. Awk 4]MDA8478368.1 DUF2531 family protein [Citrobacter sp. Awk 4]